LNEYVQGIVLLCYQHCKQRKEKVIKIKTSYKH